jgi:hypothetical protein
MEQKWQHFYEFGPFMLATANLGTSCRRNFLSRRAAGTVSAPMPSPERNAFRAKEPRGNNLVPRYPRQHRPLVESQLRNLRDCLGHVFLLPAIGEKSADNY